MPNALQIAGSQGSKPTRYAPILIHKFFKGLWTQRNPFSDAGTAFLIEKFYSGTSFDGLIDGLNVELTNKLTLRRRCGASIYNSATFSPVNRFFEFRYILNNQEQIKVIADTSTAIYDATGPTTQANLRNKGTGYGQSGAVGIGNTLYVGNALDQFKYLALPGWAANTKRAVGDLIIGGGGPTSNNFTQYLYSVKVGTITNVSCAGGVLTLQFAALNFAVTVGMSFYVTGVGVIASFQRVTALSVNGTTVQAGPYYAVIPSTGVSGVATTTDIGTPATTGSSTPSWSALTTDALITWISLGNQVFQNWTPAAPPAPPVISPVLDVSISPFTQTGVWQPSAIYPGPQSTYIMDAAGFVESTLGGGASGVSLPNFSNPTRIGATNFYVTTDGQLSWLRSAWLGKTPGQQGPSGWQASTTPSLCAVRGGDTIVDPNGYLQMAVSGSGATGATQPTFNTLIYGNTGDSGIVWQNLGAYSPPAYTGWRYGYAYHHVDGSVSSLSPLSQRTGGVLVGVEVTMPGPNDPNVDSIWLFRTADGGSTPLFLMSIQAPAFGTTISIGDTNPDSNLNFELPGPQFGVNNPPPAGFIPDCYHLGRIFGHVANTVYWSAGPDTLAGNGNAAFPASNNFQMPSLVTKQVPTAIGLLIFTTSGVYFSGTGGANSDTPTEPAPFMDGKIAGLMSPNALDLVGSTIYMVNSKKKQLQIDIAAGEQETGFPIGDLLANGNPSTSTPAINPASCYVAWHEQDSTDSALYAATPGAANAAWWYRMNPAPAPESGIMWSSQAISKSGFSAMQSIETSPGVHQLLLGPPSGGTGPILKRDTTTFADNGTAYSAYADIGSIVLAHPGQVALIDFISTFCIAVGSRPTVSVLLGEIGGHAEMVAKGAALTLSSPEPPENGPAGAVTLYNDRWWMSASQQSALCQHLQIEIAWPAENQPNELLTYALFGAHYQEL